MLRWVYYTGCSTCSQKVLGLIPNAAPLLLGTLEQDTPLNPTCSLMRCICIHYEALSLIKGSANCLFSTTTRPALGQVWDKWLWNEFLPTFLLLSGNLCVISGGPSNPLCKYWITAVWACISQSASRWSIILIALLPGKSSNLSQILSRDHHWFIPDLWKAQGKKVISTVKMNLRNKKMDQEIIIRCCQVVALYTFSTIIILYYHLVPGRKETFSSQCTVCTSTPRKSPRKSQSIHCQSIQHLRQLCSATQEFGRSAFSIR